MTLENSHPYWHLRTILEGEVNVDSLTMSYYIYHPQSLTDERISFLLSRSNFLNSDFVENFINACPADHDVAIHSQVECSDRITRHLPMVDMSTSARAQLIKLKEFLDVENFYGFVWFDSGRSFHGYGSRFINNKEWIISMGKLLLSNQKDMKPTVDPRWIGHRLIAGYAALRWSQNTKHYLCVPNKIII